MKSPCRVKDESLLMLAHGQLGWWSRMKTTLHARSCPVCREKLQRYSRLSHALSAVLASPNGSRTLPLFALRGGLVRGAFLTVAIFVLMAAFWTLRSNAVATESSAPAPTEVAPATCGSHEKAVQVSVAQ